MRTESNRQFKDCQIAQPNNIKLLLRQLSLFGVSAILFHCSPSKFEVDPHTVGISKIGEPSPIEAQLPATPEASAAAMDCQFRGFTIADRSPFSFSYGYKSEYVPFNKICEMDYFEGKCENGKVLLTHQPAYSTCQVYPQAPASTPTQSPQIGQPPPSSSGSSGQPNTQTPSDSTMPQIKVGVDPKNTDRQPSSPEMSSPPCNPEFDGYAVCPVKPAILPNGRPSESTVLSVYKRANVVAASGNFAVVRDSVNALLFKTVDQSGVIIGNGASLVNPAQVAEAIVKSGLYKSPNWKKYMNRIREMLDAAGVPYKPYLVYAGSSLGTDISSLIDGKLGSPNDWTSDANAGYKGPTALGSLKSSQVTAALLELTGANTSLLGRKVPKYFAGALGDGPGGVVYFNLNAIPGLNNAMLTKAGGYTGTLTNEDITEYFSPGYFDLFANPFYPL